MFCAMMTRHSIYLTAVPDRPEPEFFKLLWRPGIDSKETIPPAYVAGPVRQPYSYSVSSPP
jgi:hypothetical protein